MSTQRKIALITGSTDPQGLGFTAAFLLAARHGFDVVLSGRRKEACDSAASELNAKLRTHEATQGSQHIPIAHALHLDVTSSDSIASAVAHLSSSNGPLKSTGGALDVLINNAAMGAPAGRGGKGTNNMFLQTELTTAHDMDTVLSTNVSSVVAVTNALLPFLAKSHSPRIVNVSSARGSLSFGSGLEPARTGAMVYNVSKAAVNMVTLMQAKNLPQHVNSNLKVNAALPGHVKTSFNNFTGMRTVEEGAGVYVHLATLGEDGPSGVAIGDHAPFSTTGTFVTIPW